MIKILGVKEFITNLETIAKTDTPNLYRSVLRDYTRQVARESTNRTPVDTGFLRASARRKVEDVSHEGGKASVSYHAPYAIPVHENLDSRHKVGEAKYLERAVGFLLPYFPELLGSRVNAFLKRKKYRNVGVERLK